MTQTVVDLIARIESTKAVRLQELLSEIARDLPGNSLVPFSRLSLLHFSSLVIFESPDFGFYLVWEHNIDGEFAVYLRELLDKAPGVEQILSCCEGYSPGRSREYILSHLVLPSAYHIGNVGRSVDRVNREAQLRDKIEAFLDSRDFSNLSPEAVRLEIRKYVDGQPAFSWAGKAEPRMTFLERVVPYLKIGLSACIGILLVPLSPIWLVLLRWHEMRDKPSTATPDPDLVRSLLNTENLAAQNHLASITVVKPGPLRKATLRIVLFAANLLARISVKGQLSGIPTIHFAHWSLIDGGKRLLFLSNYGGSWGSYLDDFIDKASVGLTGVWTNTVGFPKTSLLVFEGSRDGPAFKNFARASQSVTRVWYSAYRDLTVPNINRNSDLREGLYGPVEATEWLRLL